ncbi:MAG: hypothetical protein IH891_06755 [Planctomycetes bacterium]|nr:hypothetical protein [Planctomycetota bacterium]
MGATDLVVSARRAAYLTVPVAIAASLALVAAFLKLTPPHRDVTDNPWLYFSIFFGLGGLQLIGLGLLGEISIRTYYESQNKRTYTIHEVRGEPRAVERRSEAK